MKQQTLPFIFNGVLKVGDKVRIIGKSVGVSINYFDKWFLGSVGYIIHINQSNSVIAMREGVSESVYEVWRHKEVHGGDFFLRKDLEKIL